MANLLTSDVARAVGLQIINAYKQKHNLPTLGAGIILPVAPERQANKSRQAKYRDNHSRVMAWDNPDNHAILQAVQTKLINLSEAKRAYAHAKKQFRLEQITATALQVKLEEFNNAKLA